MSTEKPNWERLVEQATFEELKDIYEGIMHPQDLKLEGMWIVRLFDGMDGVWDDVSAALMPEAALRVWFEKTEGGEKKTKFADVDYYRIFPANSIMHYSGDNEMFR